MISRHGYKWTVSELLSLQREYELLHLSIPKIAQIHNRSENAILAKIEHENFQHETTKETFISWLTPIIDDEMFFALISFCVITFCVRVFTSISFSGSDFHSIEYSS
jgi:hypothetical protein